MGEKHRGEVGSDGLVVADESATGGGDVGSDGLEEAEGASGDDVSSVLGDLERDGDVGLGGEIVDLVGEDGVDPTARFRSDGLEESYVRWRLAATAKENALGNQGLLGDDPQKGL
ncbi:hypothetical protein U1Q18_016220 [Sarracenia purpurea var. burkii]